MSKSSYPSELFMERLGDSRFFGALSKESLAFLLSRAKPASYEAGAAIFVEGEPSRGLYWLHSGALKALKYSISGREQILHLINAGQTFNEVGSLTTLPNPASVVALEPSEVWFIPGDSIQELIQMDADFGPLIIHVLSERLRSATALVEDLSLRPVINRLARLILEEADGDTFFRPSWYTQDELAARLGTVADVVQRSLRKLENDRLIEVERQHIHITDRDELENLAA